MRDNLIHYFRSPILCIVLLSIFPQKTIAYNWTRISLTAHRNSTIQPYTNPTTKHSNSPCLRSNCNMSTSRTTRKQLQTSNTRPILHSYPRNLLYRTTSIRIYWSTLYNRWFSIWINLFHSHRIPRTSRNYWNNILNHMLITTNNPTLLIKPPLWIWSSSMILTLCRRSMIIPIYLNLLMRKIINYSSNTSEYTWLPIKKFVQNKMNNINNHNDINNNNYNLNYRNNSSNTNFKKNSWRTRKEITLRMWIWPKKLSAATILITILPNRSYLHNLWCRNCTITTHANYYNNIKHKIMNAN